MIADPASSAEIVRQLRADGYAGDVLAGSSCGRQPFIQQAGAAADGIIFPLLVELGPPWQEFEKAFRDRFETAPDFAAGATYDAVQLLVTAVRQAGLNRARIADALARTGTLGWRLRPRQLGQPGWQHAPRTARHHRRRTRPDFAVGWADP